MQDVSRGSQTIRFGTFELDASAGELRKQGIRIRLQEQPLRILQMLLANPGQVVSREELRSVLWPTNTFVDFDHGLNRAINKLREALGDSAESPRFIETLAKRGYRFLGEPSGDARQIRSLLILPLENLSQDPEKGYFADGLTEALTTTLAKISELRVLSRTTAVFYKRAQKTLPDIVRELGVDGIVEGSVLRSEGRVRISVQLVHAPTDTHLWAESYERDMRDILVLQAEVTDAIAKQIQVKVTPHEQTLLARTPAVDPQAYDAYLRGRCYVDKRTPDANRKAIQSFEQALASDPNFALARAGLAECFNVLGWYGYVPPAEGCGKAKALALQALEIDPDLSQAHASLAWAVQYYDYDFLTAHQEFRRAIELDPRYPVAHYRYGMALTYVGRFGEAIAEAKYAASLEPFSATPNAPLCWAYWLAGRHDELFEHARRNVELHPDVPHSHWALGVSYQESRNFDGAIAEFQLAVDCSGRAAVFLAMLSETYAMAGRRNDALQVLEQLQARSSQQYVMPYMVGRVYAALDQKDEALRWLETAYAGRAAWMVMLKRDPYLSSLHSDQRFQDLVRRMKFPS
jgi:TolB-like protein/Tfp pilus assembly protein PilF